MLFNYFSKAVCYAEQFYSLPSYCGNGCHRRWFLWLVVVGGVVWFVVYPVGNLFFQRWFVMVIIEIYEQLGTLLYSALNYKYKTVYCVVYGLQHVQCDNLEMAYGELQECKEHAIQCQG